ncbi:putative Glycerophosphodiester phosphodiesterase GDE1 [Glarea lozoyensis 74030]|uniref:Putative Glycerophosphodiester phosphodiesterase GDE1 n=1 Tax=Glarea lozoyensis (strain ATCC 74030 / MF5533) TaxID=1104152 RepID=H0EQI2_GLAL7|nr:putative Glycerophosphodiester phosphodiesterase GDE1 [Glarea lozoyensis 74030]
MLFEAEDWKMDFYGIEINKFIDTIFKTTFEHGRNRPIVLASFTPEICILAAYKQTKYPVMFLSESGLYPTGDIRASSLQQAVHFAKRWGLPGVIIESNPLVASPALIGYVKEKGLGCASWGGNNDVPEHALIQAESGLDAIIVDSFRGLE